ncbi:HAMP domain-containing histidine kinase [Aerococcaceae bacterium zg-BR22]|uniref:sensor histidine kinase n=1 Tax=Aerococcaceae bacterium zg-1292 TaxID=2774330 RepID=UPI004062C628|nr:HAMP domain-containing histidine kinase [Aerococcaceae bacterium zg-BR22]
MIRQMKRRFMIVSMGAFSTVMLILFILLNIFNYMQNIQLEEQRVMNAVDIQLGLANIETSFETPTSKDRLRRGALNFEKWLDSGNSLLGTEKSTRQLTNYFYVIYDNVGNIAEAVVGWNEETFEVNTKTLSTKILKQEKERGWSGSYRFVKRTLHDGRVAVTYIDMFHELETIVHFAILSSLIFASLLIIVYLLLKFFSKRAIQPLIHNIERQKEFISNASHEIKTPLAVLSTNNDVLEMLGTQNEWTQSNRNQIKRLNNLIEQMLLLARFDEGKTTLNFTTIHLNEVVNEIVQDMQSLAEENKKTIAVDISETVTLYTDEVSVRQLVASLLENAIKYQVGEKPIEIAFHKDTYELWIRNECEPMTEEERKQLFDRFYRRDTARSRETGGSGMGLSIAKAVAQSANIHLSVTLLSPTDIAFKLKFKVSKQANK